MVACAKREDIRVKRLRLCVGFELSLQPIRHKITIFVYLCNIISLVADDESESGSTAVYENLRLAGGGGGGHGGGDTDPTSLYDVPRPIPKKIDTSNGLMYMNKSFNDDDGVYDEPRRRKQKAQCPSMKNGLLILQKKNTLNEYYMKFITKRNGKR